MSYFVGDIPVLQRPVTALDAPTSNYGGLDPVTKKLPEGFKKSSSYRGFRACTILEKDIEIPLRDGKIIRADVYRPADFDDKVPALVAWSPYGKSGVGLFSLDLVPGRVGVHQERLSGFESFEAPDPAEWTARGYAIVNVNVRGAFDSEGDIRWFGSGEGYDGYDAVEHIAKLPWCTGKVALVGNSWLAMAQWHIAAQKPPHLACIAPLEGCSDLYREIICRGGVPYIPFVEFLANMGLYGRNKQEDVIGMLRKYPFANAYWEDKRAKIENIEIPAYVLASYSTAIHTVGSFRGFEDLQTKDKWLRVHPTQEWHDLYSSDCVEDLQRYFDYFLKGIENGWENTSRVRLSTVAFNQAPEYNHEFSEWPIPGTDYQALFLSSNHQLVSHAPFRSSTLSYQSDIPSLQMDTDSEELSFEYTFSSRSYIIGYPQATLYMSCNDSDDMDVFVQLRKADTEGNVLQNINIPLNELQMEATEVVTVNTNKYLGPTGILRASRRKIDTKRSKPYWGLHEHLQSEKVSPGQMIKLVIGLWPCGILFEAGEKLIFKVAGHHMTLAEFEPLRGGFTTENKGRHVVHIGGDHPSQITIPFVKM